MRRWPLLLVMAMLAGCGVETSQRREARGALRAAAPGAHAVAETAVVVEAGQTATFRACRDRETHWIGGFVVAGLSAVHFPAGPGWHVRVSGRGREAPCLIDRVSWASTVPLRDGEFALPPQRTLATLPPDGIVIALYQFDNACLPSRPRTLPERSLPLRLDQAHESDFPGARGEELPLMRLAGRLPGRYDFDLWVFYGRRHPTAEQQRAAQAMLDQARWPAQLR